VAVLTRSRQINTEGDIVGAVLALGRKIDERPRQRRPLLALEAVNFSIAGRRLIEGLDLRIDEGEFVCVVGPSGCGKTTSLRLLAGLASPDGGRITVAGEPISNPRQDVAIVFQDYGKALLPWRTAAGNIALVLETLKTPKAEREDRISTLLARMGLAAHADKFPRQLSGGQQQRLQIARALAQEPAVLLMDEPFGALDAMTRQALQDDLLALRESTGVTVFFVTHDLEEAIYLADRVIGLLPNPGRVGRIFDVRLPSPRNQLSTREHPEFLRLRRELFDFVMTAETSHVPT
jgi:NitT/TauT family transport system ATP-binding protein